MHSTWQNINNAALLHALNKRKAKAERKAREAEFPGAPKRVKVVVGGKEMN